MLKSKISSFALLVSLSLSLVSTKSLFASEKSMESLKVAIVDVQAAILQTNEGKAAREKIEKEVSQKRQDLLNQQNSLKKLQEEFQAQQSVLSDADKQTKQKEFQTKLQAFQQSQMNFEQESRQKEAAALQKIFQNIQTEVQKIAKQKSYDMVFDKSAAVLLFANNTTDITSDVVALYNTDYKSKEKGIK
ncbi:MAG: OmpH family outer membrane protein [Bdellovibrionota bacterium]